MAPEQREAIRKSVEKNRLWSRALQDRSARVLEESGRLLKVSEELLDFLDLERQRRFRARAYAAEHRP